MKNIYRFLYIACFLLLFSTTGNSQVFNQNTNEAPHLPPPVVNLNQEDPYNFFKNGLNSPLRSPSFDDDDPNGGGTGLGELPVSDGTLTIVLFGVAYFAFTTFRVRFKDNKKSPK